MQVQKFLICNLTRHNLRMPFKVCWFPKYLWTLNLCPRVLLPCTCIFSVCVFINTKVSMFSSISGHLKVHVNLYIFIMSQYIHFGNFFLMYVDLNLSLTWLLFSWPSNALMSFICTIYFKPLSWYVDWKCTILESC